MATSAFGKAFREARASGDKTFMFNGKKYTTELAKPKTSTKPELGPEMGEKMTPAESKDAASRFGYPKGSERLNSVENTDTSDMTFKRGGKVKKMASGGMTSKASSRGDGIAARGKTRGRMV